MPLFPNMSAVICKSVTCDEKHLPGSMLGARGSSCSRYWQQRGAISRQRTTVERGPLSLPTVVCIE